MKDRAAVAAVLGLGLVWGCNWVVIKIATEDASPFVLVALRQVLGAIALFAIVALLRKPLRAPPLGWTILIGVVQIAVMTSLQTLALAVGGAGKVTVLVYTFPFWTLLLSATMLHEPLTRQRLLVTGVAVLGIICVLYPLDVMHAPLAVVFALGAALAWAFGAVFTKQFRAVHKVDLLSFTAWQMAFGAVPLVFVAFFVPGNFVHPTPVFFATLAYVVIPGTALAFWLWFFILERFSAVTAGIASLLTPVVSVLVAWAALGERPSLTEALGMVLIVAALGINSIPPAAFARSERRVAA